MKSIAFGIAGLSLLAAPVSVHADSSVGFNLKLVVPTLCKIDQVSPGAAAPQGAAFSLGRFREYCNAAAGYSVVANYAAGSLRGAVILIEGREVRLDGSGRTIISHSQGPRIRATDISIIPGANGFDSRSIDLEIIANAAA